MELSGKVKVVFATQTFDSGFKKREFVVTTHEQYPQDIKFELVKDNVSFGDSMKQGDEVKVLFNVRGNEYQGKYYVNLQAWKVEAANAGGGRQASAPASQNLPPVDAYKAPEANFDDDLPF